MTWSPGDIDVGMQSLLIQFYPILLSTLLSINNHQLSLFDAKFALTLTSSPLVIYLAVTSVCDLFGIHTNLYKRIKSYRLIIRTLGASTLVIWTGLSIIHTMSTRAFRDSSCKIRSFTDWFGDIAATFLTISSIIPGTLVILWFVCLARRWSQLRADVKLHSEGAPRLRVLWTWVKCSWCVPVDAGFRSAKSNAIKVHYRPQP